MSTTPVPARHAVITVAYRSDDLLPVLASSILPSAPFIEQRAVWIVVDNGSSAVSRLTREVLNSVLHGIGTSRFVNASLDWQDPVPIRHISGQGNVGFSAANNLGVLAAISDGVSPDYVTFVNPDVSFSTATMADRWFQYAENMGDSAAMGPTLLERGRARGMGVHIPILDLNASLSPQTHPSLAERVTSACGWTYLSGACIAMSWKLLRTVGLWDDHYFMYYEDIDLARRIRAMGGKLHVRTDVTVTHASSASFGETRSAQWKTKTQFVADSSKLFHRKFYPLWAASLAALFRSLKTAVRSALARVRQY